MGMETGSWERITSYAKQVILIGYRNPQCNNNVGNILNFRGENKDFIILENAKAEKKLYWNVISWKDFALGKLSAGRCLLMD